MKPITLIFFSLFFILGSFFYSAGPVSAFSETTLYFTSVEKVLETGEVKIYYGVGNAMAVRSSIQGVSYLHGDWLGSTAVVTTATGQRDSSIVYYPYGKETASLSSKTDKFYTGQRKDTSSDLYFYNARYYNPKTGHFVSADYAQGPNRYAYVANNPVMRTDPSGMVSNTIGDTLNQAYQSGAAIGSLPVVGDFIARPNLWEVNQLNIPQIVSEVSKETGLPASLILSLSVNEGLGSYVRVYNKFAQMNDKLNIAGEQGKHPGTLENNNFVNNFNKNLTELGNLIRDYKQNWDSIQRPNGFQYFGIDNATVFFNQMVAAGYYPKDYNPFYGSRSGIKNELNMWVEERSFLNLKEGLLFQAKLAGFYLKTVKEDSQKLGVTLTPDFERRMLFAYWNMGPANGKLFMQDATALGFSFENYSTWDKWSKTHYEYSNRGEANYRFFKSIGVE